MQLPASVQNADVTLSMEIQKKNSHSILAKHLAEVPRHLRQPVFLTCWCCNTCKTSGFDLQKNDGWHSLSVICRLSTGVIVSGLLLAEATAADFGFVLLLERAVHGAQLHAG